MWRTAVHVDDRADETVLTLRGELDSRAQQTLFEELERVEHGTERIVVELVDLTSIDAGNLVAFHRSQMVAALRGTRFVLRSPHPHVARILEATGLAAERSEA